MRVLSLFDGMSCGQIALNRLGFEIDNYYASEIDPHAMKVAKHNFPLMNHIGPVEDVNPYALPKIDLVLGGSPCQGFSFLGKGLNFEDPRSKLFFEYAKIVQTIKPKYWLLENVKMQKKSQDIISEIMGVEPVEINSALVSAQNRRRLYWANFPISQPEDLDIRMKNIIRWSRSTRYPKDKPSYVESRAYMDGKSNTLVTGDGCSTFSSKSMIIDDKCKLRPLSVNECEALQGVPKDYTSIVSNTQRYKMLGNGWNVDTICHILKGMEI